MLRNAVHGREYDDGLRSGSIRVLLAGFVVLAVAMPGLDAFQVQTLTLILINLVIAVSFRFITLMGKWSFAHLPMVGVGAYTTAVLTTQHGKSPWLMLVVAPAVAALVAIAISYPCLRSSGFYFFMSTYAAGALLVWVWSTYVDPFGGTSGLFGIPPFPPLKVPLLGTLTIETPLDFAYLVAGIAFACMFVMLRLEQMRFGVVLKAIRSQGPLAESVGARIRRYETITFVIGSAFAGLAGVLFAEYSLIVSPDDFSTTAGISILMYVVVGGVGSYWGPVIGAVALSLLTTQLGEYENLVAYTTLIEGVILIVVVLIFPGGLVSIPGRVLDAVDRVRRGVGPGDEASSAPVARTGNLQ
jgi:branched-chain amino acid transport system permease protein